MRRQLSRSVSLLLPMVVLLATPATAQKGKIVFDETTHVFGTVYEGDQATHTFTFRNEGAGPLSLFSVNPSCGCTTPEWPKEPIAPGGSGSIKVVYDSQGQPGPFHKRIAVNTDGDPMQVILNIEGDVQTRPLQDVVAQGDLLIEGYDQDLGEVEPGQIPYVRVRIQNSGDEPLLIKRVQTPGDHIFASYPGKPIGAGEIAEVAFSINTAGLQPGSNFEYELLLETDDEQQPVKTFQLQGAVKGGTRAN